MGPFPFPRAGFTHAFQPALRPNRVESLVCERAPRERLLRKTNPIEPIELKACVLREMPKILINRTHWTYLVIFQRNAAKNSAIFAKSVCSRTRIRHKAGHGRPCPKTNLEYLFLSVTYGARDLSHRRGRPRRCLRGAKVLYPLCGRVPGMENRQCATPRIWPGPRHEAVQFRAPAESSAGPEWVGGVE